MARPRKIGEEELLEIIRQYQENNPYVTTLKYSDLVKYAKSELGYNNITYQDFSRNDTVRQFIEVEKQRRDMSNYIKFNQDKLTKVDFSVDVLVDKYEKKPKQLKTVLKVFKDTYDKSFDLLSEFAESDSRNLNIIKEQEKFIERLKEQNKELRSQLSMQKKANSSSYRMEKLKWMYLLLNDMINHSKYYIETEEEVLDILKNFGYTANDVVDVEKIIEENFSLEQMNDTSESHEIEDNSCSTKDNIEDTDNNITSLRKNQLQLPNFMKKTT